MSPMDTYYPLDGPAVLFAHRGARAHAPENTLEAFTLAVRLGATGLESDVWLTADGQAVLDHDGVVGGPFRRRAMSAVQREALPAHVPTLAELYATVGSGLEVSLDVKDPAAFEEVVDVARRAGAAERLWLCHPDVDVLREWRAAAPEVRLVNSTRVTTMDGGPERRAAQLRDLGIDAVNLHHAEWSAGLVALFHRFGRRCLGWDAQHVRIVTALLRAGIDGIFSDHVDRMVDGVDALR